MMEAYRHRLEKLPSPTAFAAALGVLIALLSAACSTVAGRDSNEFAYHGYRVEISAPGNGSNEALQRAARQQVDIVDEVALGSDTRQFLQGFVIHLTRGSGGGSHFSRRGVFIQLREVADDRPILLHEFMHAYQLQRLPGGAGNPDVLRFYQHAKDAGLWAPRAYLLGNVGEFFAMSASTYLYGHADRPPWSREELERKQPQFAAWLRDHIH